MRARPTLSPQTSAPILRARVASRNPAAASDDFDAGRVIEWEVWGVRGKLQHADATIKERTLRAAEATFKQRNPSYAVIFGAPRMGDVAQSIGWTRPLNPPAN